MLNLKKGKLVFFYGPMFSGKSNKLIESFDCSTKIKLVFKPTFDTRTNNIKSRTGKKINTFAINNPDEIFYYLTDDVEEIYIDEVNFFDTSFLKPLDIILKKGIDVFLSGLDRDYRQEMFTLSKSLIKLADQSEKLNAYCHKCSKPSEYSVLLKNNKLFLDKNHPKILVDNLKNTDFKYETWCKDCLKKYKEQVI